MNEVLITGYGLVSSLGNSADELYQNLFSNRCGIEVIPEWKDLRGLHSHLGARARKVDVSFLPRTTRRTMTPMSEMAYVATVDALKMAGISPRLEGIPRNRIAFILGSTGGSSETMLHYFGKYVKNGGPEGQNATSFFKCMNHTVLANVMGALEVQAPALSVSSACATSTQAAILGAELIQAGVYDIVIAGGADELHDTAAAIFDTVLAACRDNRDPHQSIRPFDAARSGLAVSEGAGVLVLESMKSLERRGVQAKARVLGGAYTMDGDHMAQPRAEAMRTCMEMALVRAKVEPKSVQYLNAHATSTVLGDAEESRAISALFGNQVPVSSLKGHLGHSLAACGAIELISCLKMFEHQTLLPTRNLENVAADLMVDVKLAKK